LRKSILRSRAKPESQLRGLRPRFSKNIPNLGLYEKKSREEEEIKKGGRTKEIKNNRKN
jgi:hypothetical protein